MQKWQQRETHATSGGRTLSSWTYLEAVLKNIWRTSILDPSRGCWFHTKFSPMQHLLPITFPSRSCAWLKGQVVCHCFSLHATPESRGSTIWNLRFCFAVIASCCWELMVLDAHPTDRRVILGYLKSSILGDLGNESVSDLPRPSP